MASEIITFAKYQGTCAICKRRFPKDTVIMMDLASKAKWHKKCPSEKKEGKCE